MHETESNGHQVLSDGRKVWVNGRQGESVARLSWFCGQTIIDVHRVLAEQRETGNQCLDCRHITATGAEGWTYFVDSVRRHFGVELGEEHRPRWAKN